MINYRYPEDALSIHEQREDGGFQFEIKLHQAVPYAERLRHVQKVFDNNRDYTDVLFYTFPGHRYQVLVHPDHYLDFLAELWKAGLLLSLERTE